MGSDKSNYKYLFDSGESTPGMNLHPLKLFFQGDCSHLEDRFLKEFDSSSVQQMRIATVVGAILVIMFGALDMVVLEAERALTMMIRFGVVFPTAMLAYLASFASWFPQNAQRIMTAVVITVGIQLIAIVVIAPPTVSPLYFAGIMLLLFFSYSFMHFRFVWASFGGWVIVLAYPVADVLFDNTPFELLFTNIFFMATASFLGMFVAYSNEFHTRRNFFMRQILQDNRDQIEAAKNELEQRVIERTREATQAVKSKSEFLANMSHEIRTPMNGVLGMLDLLGDTKLSEEQKEYLATASSSAEGLLGVINDVLDLSKIEAGKMAVKLEPAVPALIVDEVCSLLRPEAEKKGLQLISQISPAIYKYFIMDPMRFRQIALNLLGNAIKFTSEGRVIVRTSWADGELELSIRDTGIGISESGLNRLFDSFSQVESSSARRFGGTGLGLAISRQLAVLMDGDLTVESTVGSGSEFVLKLPVEQSEREYSVRNLGLKICVSLEDQDQLVSAQQILAVLGCEIVSLEEAEVYLGDSVPHADTQIPIVIVRNKQEISVESTSLDAVRFMRQSLSLNSLSSILSLGSCDRDSDSEKADEKQYSGINVLLVEDNLVNQKVASAILSRFGVQTKIVGGGKEALLELETGEFDMVLMDCQMPDMDGFETTRAIRANEKQRDESHQIVVAITANAMEGDKQRCLDSGMDDYLSKPINSNSLKRVLNRWVDSSLQ